MLCCAVLLYSFLVLNCVHCCSLLKSLWNFGNNFQPVLHVCVCQTFNDYLNPYDLIFSYSPSAVLVLILSIFLSLSLSLSSYLTVSPSLLLSSYLFLSLIIFLPPLSLYFSLSLPPNAVWMSIMLTCCSTSALTLFSHG